MAGVVQTEEVNMNNLYVGIEYIFFMNNGRRIRGRLDAYLNDNGMPRRAVRLEAGYRINDGRPQQGVTTYPLTMINRVLRIIPPPPPPPPYVPGMRPSPRYIKHGWLANNEIYNPPMHNIEAGQIPGIPVMGTNMNMRSINHNTNPPSAYYSADDMTNMQNEIITLEECPICLESIQDNACVACINGHKFHSMCPGSQQTQPIPLCPVCRSPPPFYPCNGNYNDIMSGGKKRKGKRRKSRKSRKPRKSLRRRKSSRRRR